MNQDLPPLESQRWRCVNDVWGDCAGQPTSVADARPIYVDGPGGEHLRFSYYVVPPCAHDPRTCPHYRKRGEEIIDAANTKARKHTGVGKRQES